MKQNWAEVITGAIVLLIALGFGLYVFQVSDGWGRKPSYVLSAQFASAEGIRSGGDVRLAGVRIGQVGDMTLNKETYAAEVELLIDEDIRIPADSEVKISSQSLLGGSFVEIVPGGDLVSLQNGEQFVYSTGSMSLISLLAGIVTQSLMQNSKEN